MGQGSLEDFIHSAEGAKKLLQEHIEALASEDSDGPFAEIDSEFALDTYDLGEDDDSSGSSDDDDEFEIPIFG